MVRRITGVLLVKHFPWRLWSYSLTKPSLKGWLFECAYGRRRVWQTLTEGAPYKWTYLLTYLLTNPDLKISVRFFDTHVQSSFIHARLANQVICEIHIPSIYHLIYQYPPLRYSCFFVYLFFSRNAEYNYKYNTHQMFTFERRSRSFKRPTAFCDK